jgi:hypothetical protein
LERFALKNIWQYLEIFLIITTWGKGLPHI